VLLAANHPNGFLDGVIVSTTTALTMFIFVRGDVFKRSWSNILLRGLKLIPIFRVRDGALRESVEENNRSYDQLYRIFLRNKTVMIFPESDSLPVKRLRKLKKGTARITADMEDRGLNQDIALVPTGLNYSFYKGFGKVLHMKFSSPIFFNDSQIKTPSLAAAMLDLTAKLHDELSDMVFHIPQEMETVAEKGFEIIRAGRKPNFKFIQRDERDFAFHYNLSRLLLSEDKRQEFVEAVEGHERDVWKRGLTYKGRVPDMLSVFVSVLLLIPSFLSYIPMYAISKLGIFIANSTIQKMELYDSVVYGVGVLLTLVIDLAGIIIFGMLYGWIGILIFLVARWLSVFFYPSIDHLSRLQSELKWHRYKRKHRAEYEALMKQRDSIFEMLS